jgi:hypothetical protein
MADRSQKNRKTTRGAEKHAPEAVFDGISRLGLLSGYTVKDRMRSAWGSTKSGSSLIKTVDARVTYCILSEQTRIPKIQLRGGGVQQCQQCQQILDMTLTVACPHYHGFGCRFPLNFKRELRVRVIVNVSRMSSGSFVQRHTSDSLH